METTIYLAIKTLKERKQKYLDGNFKTCVQLCIDELENLKQFEKEQLQEVYVEGMANERFGPSIYEETVEDWYNKKFISSN